MPVMRAQASPRVQSWAVVLTLLLGFLSATGSALAGPDGGCGARSSKPMAGMPHCQWMTPAVCCDQPSSVSGATAVVPKPATSIAFLAPPPLADAALPWAPAPGSGALPRVFPDRVVLRL